MPAMSAGYYERMSDGIQEFYLLPLSEEINRTFSNGARILDVGTGTGHLPILLARGNERHHVTGLDLSRSFLRRAAARANEAGMGQRVTFFHGRVEAVEDRFDLIVSTCSLHHWRHPAAMLKAMAGRLKDAGQIWLMDDAGDASEDARRDWVRRVEASFDAGILFKTVFTFESGHLAYNETEIHALCDEAGLRISDFRIRGVFFLAKCRPATGRQD